MLKNLSGEKEEIVEPMVVNKVSNSFVKGTGDAVSSDPSFIKWHPHFYREPAVGNNQFSDGYKFKENVSFKVYHCESFMPLRRIT